MASTAKTLGVKASEVVQVGQDIYSYNSGGAFKPE